MDPFFHRFQAFSSLAKWKYAVHHRADLVRRNRLVHGLEMGPGAHIDAVYPNLAMKNQRDWKRLV
jgi:hypothetical protein